MEIEPHSRYLAQSLAWSMLGGLRNFVPVILVLLGVGREGEGQGGPSRLPTHSEKWPCHQSPAWPGGEPRGTVGAWGGELTAGMDPSSPETGKKEPGLLGMCGPAQPPSDPQPGEGVTASHAAPEQEAFALISRCLLPQPLCPRVLWGGSMNPGRGQCPPLPGGAPAEAGSPCPRGAPSPLPCLLATSDQ